MHPDTFWCLTLVELADMAEAVTEDERKRAEDRYFRSAWQTAHLMNATGHYKRPVTPSKLLGKGAQHQPSGQYESREAKLAALAALKAKFQQ